MSGVMHQIFTARKVLSVGAHADGDAPFITVATMGEPLIFQWPFELGGMIVAAVKEAQAFGTRERKKAGKSPLENVVKKNVTGFRLGVDNIGQAVMIQVEYADKSTDELPIPRNYLEPLIGQLTQAVQGFKAQDGQAKQ